MKISVDENGDLVLEELYNGVMLKTNDGEKLFICMRDDGFEIRHGGSMYTASGGNVEFNPSNQKIKVEYKEVMGMVFVDGYKDGGTKRYAYKGKDYYRDRRIHSTTQGCWYSHYPGEVGSNLIKDKDLIKELDSALATLSAKDQGSIPEGKTFGKKAMDDFAYIMLKHGLDEMAVSLPPGMKMNSDPLPQTGSVTYSCFGKGVTMAMGYNSLRYLGTTMHIKESKLVFGAGTPESFEGSKSHKYGPDEIGNS